MQEIICVLDMSGSMQTFASDAVGGFNKFLDDQKKVGDANITIVWFDDKFKVGYEGDINKAEKVDAWPNGGMTALLDAIGKTFNHVQERFSQEKPEKVVMAILTDGHENDSREFTKETVAKLIKEHEKNYNWDVLFLAADQDAWAAGQQFGIRQENAVGYSSTNTAKGFSDYSDAVTRSRTA